jgi:hypothetical protein
VTRPFDISSVWRVGSPHHRKVHVGRDWRELLALVLRLVAVGLLSGVGWIHLHLWQTGYRHIPTIGPLFLAAAVSAFVVGAGWLARPSRLMGLLAIGVAVGILAGLIVSANMGLFGFKESLSAPFAFESILLEIATVVTGTAWMAVDLMEEARHTEQARRASPTSRRLLADLSIRDDYDLDRQKGSRVHVHPAARPAER